MRVLVCGGRDYTDRDHIHNTLCKIDAGRGPITCVIHGCATGADNEGMIWAQMMDSLGRSIKHAPFKAAWADLSHPDAVIRRRRDGTLYDAVAGHRRNQRMLDEGKPDLVVAFPGGRGTADMVRRAKAAGVEVIEIAARKE
jgi:hypothetical protein